VISFAAVVWLMAGCGPTGEVKPTGENMFAIIVRGVESASDTPEETKDKLRTLFQSKAQQITEGRHYERYELVSFEAAHETKGGVATPVGRGTIRCFR
jgi:hypothetical protein